ncbi:putative SAUR-like auxin-responsive protein family [Hibiscus syriacus]|uniref:SAUR-like auxin-responsive protein family n=1 Tax=Hibiscus syriacus TaxID=106335 RepID=A0A6A2ZZ02_HIBSY|nr:putative SAUR-like auxin-responsive protein family [Hibiscus syriacus]
MAAQVSSSLVRVLSGHMEEQQQNKIHTGNSDILITKDLLGNLSKAKTDLEFKATGKVEARNCSSSPLSSSPKSPLSDGKGKNPLPNFLQDSKLQDLNFPPINLFEEMTTSLDLKLQSCPTPSLYQSVCTLDKVKHALERAEKGTAKKRSPSPTPPQPAAQTTTSSSSSKPKMFAAACPGCLLYVIASNTNPRCPRCDSFVPSSPPMKKPRLDLNSSF